MFLYQSTIVPVQRRDRSSSLSQGHIHEALGTGACRFALRVAGQMQGPVLWVQCEQGAGRSGNLNPHGLAAFLDPSRLILARCPKLANALAVAEDALRSGAIPLVMLDLPARPGLIPGRRLNLAAETGQATGLMLLPEAPQGIMTAWTVRHVDAATGHETMIRARTAASLQQLQAPALTQHQLSNLVHDMKRSRAAMACRNEQLLQTDKAPSPVATVKR